MSKVLKSLLRAAGITVGTNGDLYQTKKPESLDIIQVADSVDIEALLLEIKRNTITDLFLDGEIDAITAASQLKEFTKPALIH